MKYREGVTVGGATNNFILLICWPCWASREPVRSGAMTEGGVADRGHWPR